MSIHTLTPASMTRIQLDATFELHRQLAERCAGNWDTFARACREANEEMAADGVHFETARQMPVALSALVLNERDEEGLRQGTELLHSATEKVLDHVIASPELVARYFSEHVRVLPFVRKTRGMATWQGVSRYDAIVTPQGDLKFVELNTACPAGFFNSWYFSEVTSHALGALEIDLNHVERFGTLSPDSFIDGLLDTEREAEIEPATIGLINDENQLTHELSLMISGFAEIGREAVIANAADLEYRDGRLYAGDKPLSILFNKIRVSTADSPHHCWKPGFEQRYAPYLQAMVEDAVVSINNLGAVTIGEDKALLALFRLPECRELLTQAEREYVDEYVLWTAPLAEGTAEFEGQTIDLLSFVRANRERFVVKPANEGRGYEVTVGKFVSQEQWEAALRPRPELPAVVQEFAEPAMLQVVGPQNGDLVNKEMFLTVALGVVRGEFAGVMPRISANPVTNVAREGMVQAVFCTR